MESLPDLTIQGKKGPFALRKLKTKEFIELSQSARGGSIENQYLSVVQKCLVYERTGKEVYTAKQLDKMDAELGGGRVMVLGTKAFAMNGFEEFAKLAGMIEEAEKN